MVFNTGVPLPLGGITLNMRRQAISELEANLTSSIAPLDRFARGDQHAMPPGQKRGALRFFGKAGCVDCHAIAASLM
jgi:cytochrome c peroxidase